MTEEWPTDQYASCPRSLAGIHTTDSGTVPHNEEGKDEEKGAGGAGSGEELGGGGAVGEKVDGCGEGGGVLEESTASSDLHIHPSHLALTNVAFRLVAELLLSPVSTKLIGK